MPEANSMIDNVMKILKRDYKKIIFIIGVSPILFSIFWLIFDPLIGYTSPRIDYGKVETVPYSFIGRWEGIDYNVEYVVGTRLRINDENILLIIGDNNTEKKRLNCKTTEIEIDYVRSDRSRLISESIIHYFSALLPRTLYANQRLSVKCENQESNKYKKWVLEMDVEQRPDMCLNLAITYTDQIIDYELGEEPANFDFCLRSKTL